MGKIWVDQKQFDLIQEELWFEPNLGLDRTMTLAENAADTLGCEKLLVGCGSKSALPLSQTAMCSMNYDEEFQTFYQEDEIIDSDPCLKFVHDFPGRYASWFDCDRDVRKEVQLNPDSEKPASQLYHCSRQFGLIHGVTVSARVQSAQEFFGLSLVSMDTQTHGCFTERLIQMESQMKALTQTLYAVFPRHELVKRRYKLDDLSMDILSQVAMGKSLEETTDVMQAIYREGNVKYKENHRNPRKDYPSLKTVKTRFAKAKTAILGGEENLEAFQEEAQMARFRIILRSLGLGPQNKPPESAFRYNFR